MTCDLVISKFPDSVWWAVQLGLCFLWLIPSNAIIELLWWWILGLESGLMFKLCSHGFFFFVARRSLTRNTTQPGTALSGETSAVMWPTRPSISFISTWVRWPFCCSSPAEGRDASSRHQPTIHTVRTDWLDKGTIIPWQGATMPFLCCFLPCSVLEDWERKKHTMWPC